MSGARSLIVGRSQGGSAIAWPLEAALRHALAVGPTRSGKTGFLISTILQLMQLHPEVRITYVDVKGEGASELTECFLPALHATNGSPAPSGTLVIAPFSSYGIPLNPLAPVAGLEPEVQANLVCGLFSTLVTGMGERMTAMLAWLTRAVILAHGNLLDVRELLRSEESRVALASRLSDPDVRRYLEVDFEGERRASVESLRSRLEWVLQLPAVRGMLCARSCISPRDILEAPISVVNLGGAPQGFAGLTQFFGTLVFQKLTAGVFGREEGTDVPAALLVVDEWQELAKGEPDDFERLLSLAAYKKVGVWLANQTLGQVQEAGGALLHSLLTNVTTEILFRPPSTALRHLDGLLPVTGRAIDPARPDRLLTTEEEKRRLLKELTALPSRHALFVNRENAGDTAVMRTLDVNYDGARRLAESSGNLDAFRRGSRGIEMARLIAEARPTIRGAGPFDDAPRPAPRGARRRRPPPKLVLP